MKIGIIQQRNTSDIEANRRSLIEKIRILRFAVHSCFLQDKNRVCLLWN